MTLLTGKDSTVLVTVGVDTHLDEHVAVALDHLGRHLGALSVPTTKAGYAKFLRLYPKTLKKGAFLRE